MRMLVKFIEVVKGALLLTAGHNDGSTPGNISLCCLLNPQVGLQTENTTSNGSQYLPRIPCRHRTFRTKTVRG